MFPLVTTIGKLAIATTTKIVTKITFDSHKLSSVQLYPINLGHGKSRAVSGRPLLSDNTLGNTILGRIKYISEKYGTTIRIHDNIGEIEL